MNSWSFTGNLGRDCEQRYTANGDSVVSFSVGVKSGYGDRATTTWVKCSMFGKRGDAVAPFLLRGQLVGVVGELSEREWTDKDGMKRSSLEVRVNDLTLLGKRDNDSRPPVRSQQGTSTAASDFDESQDIPF